VSRKEDNVSDLDHERRATCSISGKFDFEKMNMREDTYTAAASEEYVPLPSSKR